MGSLLRRVSDAKDLQIIFSAGHQSASPYRAVTALEALAFTGRMESLPIEKKWTEVDRRCDGEPLLADGQLSLRELRTC